MLGRIAMGVVLAAALAGGACLAQETPMKDEPQQETVARGALLFADDFSGDLSAWAVEGDGGAGIEEGRLVLRPVWTRADGTPAYGAMNIWLRRKMPADFVWEFDYHPVQDQGQNLVFMLAAGLMDGTDLIEKVPERSGHYVYITNSEASFGYKEAQLQGRYVPPLRAYTVSYWVPNGYRIPARKNPGHLLVADLQNPDAKKGTGTPHRITIIKRGGVIRFLEDGQERIRVNDPGGQEVIARTRRPDGTLEGKPVTLPIYGEGYIGLRTLGAVPAFDNMRVYALPPAERPAP